MADQTDQSGSALQAVQSGSALQAVQSGSALQAVSNAMVRLHKEQFGRGPTKSRAFLAGPDALTCVLEDALLPPAKS